MNDCPKTNAALQAKAEEKQTAAKPALAAGSRNPRGSEVGRSPLHEGKLYLEGKTRK